jgi:tRNA(His) guanylyltransferase
MASDRTSLGDRMKGYEQVTRTALPRRTFTILRVDGKAFHSLLRHANKPFDMDVIAAMDAVTTALCEEISGAVFGYTQSDEASILLTDFAAPGTQPWFAGGVQKMVSIAASAATVAFNDAYPSPSRSLFDARVFTIPDPVEVANYFLWRQRDCVRNSISMAAQAHFSHKSLHRLDSGQMQEKLWAEADVNWNDYPDGCKRGRVTVRKSGERDVTYTDKRTQQEVNTVALRSWWETEAAPHFTANSDGFLADIIPAIPGLGARRPA